MSKSPRKISFHFSCARYCFRVIRSGTVTLGNNASVLRFIQFAAQFAAVADAAVQSIQFDIFLWFDMFISIGYRSQGDGFRCKKKMVQPKNRCTTAEQLRRERTIRKQYATEEDKMSSTTMAAEQWKTKTRGTDGDNSSKKTKIPHSKSQQFVWCDSLKNCHVQPTPGCLSDTLLLHTHAHGKRIAIGFTCLKAD